MYPLLSTTVSIEPSMFFQTAIFKRLVAIIQQSLPTIRRQHTSIVQSNQLINYLSLQRIATETPTYRFKLYTITPNNYINMIFDLY